VAATVPRVAAARDNKMEEMATEATMVCSAGYYYHTNCRELTHNKKGTFHVNNLAGNGTKVVRRYLSPIFAKREVKSLEFYTWISRRLLLVRATH
jgi:hypothetical protein